MAKKNKNSPTVDEITAHFASTYISSNGHLQALQNLCEDLKVDIGGSINQCKKNIKSAHVNIHDFVRVQRDGGDVNVYKFRSYKALRQDIQDNPHRRFPLRRAKQSEILKAMLIVT